MDSIFFVGCYSEMIASDFGGNGDGIYTMRLNSSTAEIELLHTFKSRNPSYLALSEDNKYLYSITEVVAEKQPTIQAYEIQKDYSLQFLNELNIDGSLPCHIAFAQKTLLVSCYGSGNIMSFSTGNSGELLDNKSNVYHSGSSVNSLRQESPHAHQAVFLPNQNKIYVPDLGIDSVKVYTLINGDLIELQSEEIFVTKGFGPRHLVFDKLEKTGYLINELTSTVSVLQLENHKFIQKEVHSTLPDFFDGIPSASAIRMHPNGQFLYVGNRNIDSITVFKIDDDNLHFIQCKTIGGKTLREFSISPDGNWLMACLQDSNEIKAYHIDALGHLIDTNSRIEIGAPVAVLFFDS